jgi:chaperonin GroES
MLITWGVAALEHGTQNKRSKTKTNITVMTNIKPLADRVLVRPAEAEQKTASGIIIPDTAKEKPQRGEVLAVGKGTKDHEMTVKVGDQVLYGKYSGTEIEIDGEKLMIMKESDIYAII